MLALFEVLSFKGWLDVRDVLIKVLGPVSSSVLLVSELLTSFRCVCDAACSLVLSY